MDRHAPELQIVRPLRRDPPMMIRPSRATHFERRGWQWAEKRRAVGYYRTRIGSWRGEIRVNLIGRPAFYVFDPPEHVLSGHHGSCFIWKGKGTGYLIHFQRRARDIDSGIMAAEAVLAGRV